MIQNISINISEKHNCFLWFPVKTASSHAAHVLGHFEFSHVRSDYYRRIIQSKTDTLHHHHGLSLFDGHEDYKLITTVRNPYSRMVSLYEWMSVSRDIESFEVFMGDYKKNPVQPIFEKRIPDYALRQENLFDDYLKIPFVRNSELNESGILKELCDKKINKGRERKPVKDYYNQDTANIVFTNYREYFDLFGYDIDSWKVCD